MGSCCSTAVRVSKVHAQETATRCLSQRQPKNPERFQKARIIARDLF